MLALLLLLMASRVQTRAMQRELARPTASLVRQPARLLSVLLLWNAACPRLEQVSRPCLCPVPKHFDAHASSHHPWRYGIASYFRPFGTSLAAPEVDNRDKLLLPPDVRTAVNANCEKVFAEDMKEQMVEREELSGGVGVYSHFGKPPYTVWQQPPPVAQGQTSRESQVRLSHLSRHAPSQATVRLSQEQPEKFLELMIGPGPLVIPASRLKTDPEAGVQYFKVEQGLRLKPPAGGGAADADWMEESTLLQVYLQRLLPFCPELFVQMCARVRLANGVEAYTNIVDVPFQAR